MLRYPKNKKIGNCTRPESLLSITPSRTLGSPNEPAHRMRSETRRSLPMFPQLQKLACIVGQERCLFLCYYEHQQLGLFSDCSLFLCYCPAFQLVPCIVSVCSAWRESGKWLRCSRTATATANRNRASEHEHEHRIAVRASNVAPKNTVRRKPTGEALAAAPAQTATVPNPNRPLPTPFFSFPEKTGAVEL